MASEAIQVATLLTIIGKEIRMHVYVYIVEWKVKDLWAAFKRLFVTVRQIVQTWIIFPVYGARVHSLIRRAVLLLWKRRNGSKATYNRLISIFERTDYKSYAENIRRIVCVSNNEMDDSSSVTEFATIIQPPTYSICHPPNYSPPSPQVTSLDDDHELSSCKDYEFIYSGGNEMY